MNRIILTLSVLILFGVSFANAEVNIDGPYSIKVNSNIGLGRAYYTSSNNGIFVSKSTNYSFGVDFRYRFWQNKTMSVGVNAGLAYATGSQTLGASELSFNYAAGSEADMDGDSYQRYTRLTSPCEKVSLGEMIIPVYADFNWQFSERVSLYANAGIGFRISTMTKSDGLTGSYDVYGVYAKYDNLKIDDEGYNDFGHRRLDGVSVNNPSGNAFTIHVMAGAGLRCWIYGPLSLECGVNYCYGFMNRINGGKVLTGTVTAEQAVVAYTVKSGAEARSLTSGLLSNKLSNVSLNVALIFNI